MRFHVVWRKSHEPEEAYRDFYEKRDEIVRDFDAEVYR